MKKLITHIFCAMTLLAGLPSNVMAASCAAAAKEALPSDSKDIFCQGESVEFFSYSSLPAGKENPSDENALLTDENGKAVDISKCSNFIATFVGNNNDESQQYKDINGNEQKGYLVNVYPPRLDSVIPHPGQGKYDCFGKANGLSTSKQYRLKKEILKAVPHIEVGWTYGAMVIPFKRYVGGNSLKDGTTLGAYVGYKNFFPETAYSFTPVVAFGYANQKYDAIDQTTSKMKEFTAGMLSYAIGASVGFSYDRFQVGLLYGRDTRSSFDPAAPSFRNNWWSVLIGMRLDASAPSLFPLIPKATDVAAGAGGK